VQSAAVDLSKVKRGTGGKRAVSTCCEDSKYSYSSSYIHRGAAGVKNLNLRTLYSTFKTAKKESEKITIASSIRMIEEGLFITQFW
jgi:hypothetical protein